MVKVNRVSKKNKTSKKKYSKIIKKQCVKKGGGGSNNNSNINNINNINKLNKKVKKGKKNTNKKVTEEAAGPARANKNKKKKTQTVTFEDFKNEIEKILNVTKILDIEMLNKINQLTGYDTHIETYINSLEKLAYYEEYKKYFFDGYYTRLTDTFIENINKIEGILPPDPKRVYIVLVPGDSGSKLLAIDQLFETNIQNAKKKKLYYCTFPLSSIGEWGIKLYDYLDYIIEGFKKEKDISDKSKIIFGLFDLVCGGVTIDVLRDYLSSRNHNIDYFPPGVDPLLLVEVPMYHRFQGIFHCAELLNKGAQPSRCVKQFTKQLYLGLEIFFFTQDINAYQFFKNDKEKNIYCNLYIFIAWFYITKRAKR